MKLDRDIFGPGMDWLVVRSPELCDRAAAIESRVLAIVQASCAAPTTSRLENLSGWLVEEERRTPGTARKIRDAVKHDTDVAEYASMGAIRDIAAMLVGGPVRLHDIVRFRTVMRDLDFTHSRPHQDLALWPDNPNHINVWVALCDVCEALSPLQIVPGSGVSLRAHAENCFQQFEVEAFDEGQETVQKIPVRYGEVIFFSPRVIHYSAPNLTDRVRWSLDFRFSKLTQDRAHP